MFSISKTGFTLFSLDIRWYGALIALGVALAVFLASRREKRLGLPKDAALDVTLIGVPLAIICARIYYVIFAWDAFRDNPIDILYIHEGGLAFYGGLLGGLLGGWIYSRIKKIPFLALADLAAPSFALGQAIGRWGNFLNEEAYGSVIRAESLQFFPMGVYIMADGCWHYSTFFYESIWCMGIVGALCFLEKRHYFQKTGDIFWWYCLLYALERAAVEGLRSDSLYWGPIRVSQALSLAGICAIIMLFFTRRSSLRRGLRAALAALLSACAFMLLLLRAPFWAFALYGVVALGIAVVAYRAAADRHVC